VRFAPGLVALALLLTACPEKKACKIHSDCPETERCVRSECTVICRVDRDCDSMGGGRCVFGDCVVGGTGGGGVTGGGAGGGGGEMIDAGTDAGLPDAGATDAGFDAGLPDAGLPDAGFDAGLPDAGVDAGIDDAGSPVGQYGDGCNTGRDCASNLCIGTPSGLRMCTLQCTSEGACNQGHACLPVQDTSGIINICVPSDSGRSCPTGSPAPCEAGICLVHPGSVSLSVCTTPCETTHSCPNGFSCSLVQVGANMQKVCSPVASSCNAQGNTTQCISRWCSTQPQVPTQGICTGNCSAATDCPGGWACGLDDNGGGVVDRCQPIGMTCNVNGGGFNNCFSKTCATGTPQGDYCTAFCMDGLGNQQPARCPPGWVCLNEGMAGNPLWVCEQP
jgi:hypothetical protein